MPDKTDFQNPGKEFARNVAALAPSPRRNRKGGIMSPDNYKSFIVNIRPTTWKRRFWIGKIENYEDAQFIADLVYYYIGHECFHLLNVDFNYPALECEGASAPLTSREMCFKYAMSIAKGPKSQQQKEFIESVKKLAAEEVKSVKVQTVLQQLRNRNSRCVTAEEHREEEEREVQSQKPMEVDGPKHLPLVLTSHEWVTRNVDGMNAHVPGFDIGDTGFHLQSALTPVDSSWVESYLAGIGDYDGRLNQDVEDFGTATGVEEEYSCHHHSANGEYRGELLRYERQCSL